MTYDDEEVEEVFIQVCCKPSCVKSESKILDILYTALLAKSSAKPPDYHIAIKLATLYLQAKKEVNYMCNGKCILWI